jgi:hypothetical protein
MMIRTAVLAPSRLVGSAIIRRALSAASSTAAVRFAQTGQPADVLKYAVVFSCLYDNMFALTFACYQSVCVLIVCLGNMCVQCRENIFSFRHLMNVFAVFA